MRNAARPRLFQFQTSRRNREPFAVAYYCRRGELFGANFREPCRRIGAGRQGQGDRDRRQPFAVRTGSGQPCRRSRADRATGSGDRRNRSQFGRNHSRQPCRRSRRPPVEFAPFGRVTARGNRSRAPLISLRLSHLTPFNRRKRGRLVSPYPAFSRLFPHIPTYGENTRRATCPPLSVFARAVRRPHLRRAKIPLTPTRARRAPLFIVFYVLYHKTVPVDGEGHF